MSCSKRVIPVIVVISALLLSFENKERLLLEEKQIEVSLRMLGHEVLLAFGDSSSRVLPIIKKEDVYRIRFESDFGFQPEDLVVIVKRVVQETELASNYFIEIEDCANKEIVYSFKVDDSEKSDIIPCQERGQPKACYNILFTIIEPEFAEVEGYIIPSNNESESEDQGNLALYFLATIPLVILVLLFILRRKRGKVELNPNLISLGHFLFDLRNMELLINDKKIELTSKESDLLKLLYDEANATVEKERILNQVWGDEGDYVGRTLDVFISKLRKKLEADSNLKIVNVRGIGYKLVLNE